MKINDQSFELSSEEKREFEIIEQLDDHEEASVEDAYAYIQSLRPETLPPHLQHLCNLHLFALHADNPEEEVTAPFRESATYQTWYQRFGPELVLENSAYGFADLKAFAELANALEMVKRRDHHAYLLNQGDDEDSLSEYLAKYGAFIRFDTATTATDIARFEHENNVALPDEQKLFYAELGQLMVQFPVASQMFDVSSLQQSLNSPERWSRLDGIGILDMLNFVWSNSHDWFSEESGNLTAGQIDDLNTRYKSLGHIRVDDNVNLVIYYDEHGRYGAVWYNQDDGDIFTLFLEKMLEQSPAHHSLSQILGTSLVLFSAPMLSQETARQLFEKLADHKN